MAAGRHCGRNGTSFYVGSIPTGAVFRGDLRPGLGSVLVPGAERRAAIRVAFDHGELFVAGGPTGKAFVYNAKTGALIREVQLASGADPTFINDVVSRERLPTSRTRTAP